MLWIAQKLAISPIAARISAAVPDVREVVQETAADAVVAVEVETDQP